MSEPIPPAMIASFDQMLAQAQDALGQIVDNYGTAVEQHGAVLSTAQLTRELTAVSPGQLVTMVIAAVSRLHAHKATPS
jgi:hypothetical protein